MIRYFIGLIIPMVMMSCKSPTSETTNTYESFSGITITVEDSSTYGYHIVEIDSSDWLLNYSPMPPFHVSRSPYSKIHSSIGDQTLPSNMIFKVSAVRYPLNPYISPAYPNPTTDSIKIIFINAKRTFISISLIDSTYKTVKVFVQGSMDAGICQMTSNLLSIDGTKLIPGTYRCLYSWMDTVTNVYSPYQSVGANISGFGDIRIK